MKRFVLTLMMFVTLGSLAWGQTNITVSGTVTDTSTNTPVPFFPIFIDALDGAGVNQTSFVLSDALGNYVDTFFTTSNQFDSVVIGYTPCLVQAMTTDAFFNVTSNVVNNISTCGGGGGNPLCDASFQILVLGNNYVFQTNAFGGPGTTHNWSFGDGSNSSQASPSHTYASTGTYNVCHIISGPNCADTVCQVVTATGVGGGNPCSAFFFPFPDSNLNTWHFLPADTSLASYYWIFGDGTVSTQIAPSHTYAAIGNYTVCLAVSDGNGCIDTFCQPLGIIPPPNPCDASFTVAPLGTLVCFFPTNPNAATYNWTFGDGNTSATSHPNHQYVNAGTYNVCLILDDGNGCMDTSCQSIVVTAGGGNPWCDATFFPLPDTNTYTWTFFPIDTSYTSYQWDFGDGNTSTSVVPMHIYATAGTFNVCLIVSTNNCSDTLCATLVTGPPVPVCDANFAFSIIGQNMVDFIAVAPAATYSWSFGDGSTGTSQQMTHSYAAAGTYNVCLIATDGLGCADTVCQQISTSPIVAPGVIFGIAMTDTTPATDFTAYLIVFDSLAGTLTAIDTMVSVNQGGFFALIAPTGDYLVKVALNSGDPNFTGYMPTYNGDEMLWSNATRTHVNMFPFLQINMISGTNPGGPGFVGGLVSQGANKSGEGDPMAGIQVLLMDMAGNAVLHATTNLDGEFSFDDIPYGTYEVIVEMWGKTHDPYQVTISATTPSVDNLGFEVNETEIVALGVTAIDPADVGVGTMKLYPNPTTGNARLSFQLDQVSQLDMRVLNMLGQEIVREQKTQAIGNINWNLEMSDKPEGMYFIQLIVDGKALPSQRFVIKK